MDNYFENNESVETSEFNASLMPDDNSQRYKIEDKKPPSFSKTAVIFTCVALSLIVGVVSGFASASYYINNFGNRSQQGNNGDSNSDSNTINITVDETVNSSVEAVAAKVRPSVVGIRTTAAIQNFFGGSNESTGEGSGIVYTTDGYIITNYHVIDSAVNTSKSTIEVFFEDEISKGYPATVVGYNISYDLAVIKIEKTSLRKIELADTSNLKVGQYCVAVGSPGGLEYIGSVTNGVISGLNRTIPSSDYNSSVSLIQTDTAINPGNSGGALVNLKGELIGVNSSKIVSESYEGMGFAIPTNTVVDICDKIIAKEYDPDPYIGITFSESWNAELLEQYGYPVGVVVKSVISGGPAYEAGIRSGDIIIKFNGKETKNYDEFSSVLSDCKPNSSVSVYIYRSGRYYTASVVIGSNNAQ